MQFNTAGIRGVYQFECQRCGDKQEFDDHEIEVTDTVTHDWGQLSFGSLFPTDHHLNPTRPMLLCGNCKRSLVEWWEQGRKIKDQGTPSRFEDEDIDTTVLMAVQH